jgi:hypothetical protein
MGFAAGEIRAAMNSSCTETKKSRVTCRSIISLGMISLLVLFLAASQPHRVHHLFENLPESGNSLQKNPPEAARAHPAHHPGPHDHGSHSHHAPDSRTAHAASPEDAASPLHAHTPRQDAHNDGGAAQTECLLQSVAQNSHLNPVHLAAAAVVGIDGERVADRPAVPFHLFNPSPFSQRAPPPA